MSHGVDMDGVGTCPLTSSPGKNKEKIFALVFSKTKIPRRNIFIKLDS